MKTRIYRAHLSSFEDGSEGYWYGTGVRDLKDHLLKLTRSLDSGREKPRKWTISMTFEEVDHLMGRVHVVALLGKWGGHKDNG